MTTQAWRDHMNRLSNTNYPGMGVTAAVEAFNAYKLHKTKTSLLTPAQYVEYDRLVREYEAIWRSTHEGLTALDAGDYVTLDVLELVIEEDA